MERGTLGLVIRISRLVGVAPYMRRAKDGVSRPIFVLGLTAVTSIILYTLGHLTITIMNKIDNNRNNMMMLDIIRMLANYWSVIVLMIGVCTSAKRIAHMVRNLKKLDEIRESIRSKKLPLLRETTTHYFVWIYMLGTLAMRITDCYIKKSSSTSPLFGIFMATVRVLLELCLLQVVLFSTSVLATLKMINGSLRQLLTERNEKGQNKYMNNRTLKPKLAFVYPRDDRTYLKNLHNNKYLQEDVANIDVNEPVEYTIRRLSKSYSIICEIIKDTIDVNGIFLILALLNYMLLLELITYYIILWITYENNFSFETIYLIYHDITYASGLFLIVDTFHQTHAEMDRTELLVKCLKCQNEPPLPMSNELDLFQHVLVLQKTTYSPLNMCTLDRPLLVKVFGMLISYLVIIITYGSTLDSSAKKHMLDLLQLTRKF